jgi:hypothetical protein
VILDILLTSGSKQSYFASIASLPYALYGDTMNARVCVSLSVPYISFFITPGTAIPGYARLNCLTISSGIGTRYNFDPLWLRALESSSIDSVGSPPD